MLSTSDFFTTAVFRLPINTLELMDLGSVLLVTLLVWTFSSDMLETRAEDAADGWMDREGETQRDTEIWGGWKKTQHWDFSNSREITEDSCSPPPHWLTHVRLKYLNFTEQTSVYSFSAQAARPWRLSRSRAAVGRERQTESSVLLLIVSQFGNKAVSHCLQLQQAETYDQNKYVTVQQCSLVGVGTLIPFFLN